MKDFIKNRPNFERVEFWAATTIFVFLVFFHISDTMNGEWARDYRVRTGRLNYFVFNLAKYVALYVAFIVMSFRVVPQLVEKKQVLANILLAILVIAMVATVFGVSRRFLHADPYQRGNPFYYFQNSILYAIWLTLVFGFYSTIKYLGIYVLSNTNEIKTRFPFVTYGGLIAILVWLITLLFLIVHNAPRDVIGAWCVIPLSGILFYWLALYKLIPAAHKKRKSFRFYLLWSFLMLFVSVLPVGLIALVLTEQEDSSLGIAFFNFAFHFLITTPFTWVVFKRLSKGNEEIYQLQEKLGRSNANFDFLRSQINPHFLFNALNTIYGTAIQEKAERTSEGIEKLGDMMRFMLQENMQDKIPLTREIDYLENYISLQKLRTDTSPDIKILSDIEREVGTFQIPPMLLIPFVENAFKHGISFRQPSHIRILLEMKGKVLNFDVYNSKHDRNENDPEKNKSGIGLNNVKQRLQLAYPNRHELIIRETQKEFFIHLTIQLT